MLWWGFCGRGRDGDWKMEVTLLRAWEKEDDLTEGLGEGG